MQVKFITDLVTIRPGEGADISHITTRGPKRQLFQDFSVEVSEESGKVTTITVPKGFVFDGASIPRLLWLLFPPGYGPAHRAAAIHDYLYNYGYNHYSKRYADDLFRATMLADGANPFIAWAFWRAVRLGGKGGWARV